MTPVASNTCYDNYTNCPDVAKTKCYKHGDSCKKVLTLHLQFPSRNMILCSQCNVVKAYIQSCGLCKGMAPVQSNTCYDRYSNCPELAKTNCLGNKENCKKVRHSYLHAAIIASIQSCGLCDGMTPHPSNKCSDNYKNCPELATDNCFKKNVASNCCISCGLGNTGS